MLLSQEERPLLVSLIIMEVISLLFVLAKYMKIGHNYI